MSLGSSKWGAKEIKVPTLTRRPLPSKGLAGCHQQEEMRGTPLKIQLSDKVWGGGEVVRLSSYPNNRGMRRGGYPKLQDQVSSSGVQEEEGWTALIL